MPAQVVEVLLYGNAEKLKKAFAESSAAAETSAGTMTERLAGVGTKVAAAAGVAAVAVGVFSLKMADDFEASHARLETAIKNAGDSISAEADNVSKLDSKMEKLGFTNSDTENSLSRLVTATGNVKQSTDLMGLAADLARARHMDLAAATDMLVKVEGGRYTALTRTLGVSKDVIASFHSTADAVDYLSQHFGGQAAAYSDTFAGKLQTLQATAEDLGVKIGMALIPIIEKLAGVLESVIGWFEKNRAVAITLGAAVGGFLVTAFTALTVLKIADWASKIGEAFSAVVSGAQTLALKVMYLSDAGFAGLASSAIAILGPLALVAGAIYVIANASTIFGNHLEMNTKQLQGMNSGQLQKAATGLVTMGKAMGDTSLSNDAFNKILDQSPALAQRFITAADNAGLSTSKWKKELQDHADQTRTSNAAQQAYNELVDQGTQKVTAQNIALQQNIDLLAKSANAKIADQQQQLAQTDAINAYTGAAVGAIAAGGQDAAANETLQKAMLGAESAILSAAAAHEKATGKAEDYKAELQQVAGTLNPGSPLAVWLNDYINTLNSTPADKSTTFHSNAGDIIVDIQNLGAAIANIPSNPTITVTAVKAGNAWEAISGGF